MPGASKGSAKYCVSRATLSPELHDTHGVGRLAVVRQDKFGDPEIAAANDSLDRKALSVGLNRARGLYVAAAADAFARLGIFQHRVFVIDAVLRFKIVGIGRRPMPVEQRARIS